MSSETNCFICVCSLLEHAGITPSCERPYKVTVNKSNSGLGKDFSASHVIITCVIQLLTFSKRLKNLNLLLTLLIVCQKHLKEKKSSGVRRLKLFSGLTAPVPRLEVQIKPTFLIMSSSVKAADCVTHLLSKYAAYEEQPIRITADFKGEELTHLVSYEVKPSMS